MTDVLVTGAAGGLGGALVDALRGAGRPRRRARLNRPADVAPGRAGATSWTSATATRWPHAIADAAAAGLEVRHVVAIAGGALPEEKRCADPAELPLETFRASLELNLVTAWVTLQAALPALRRPWTATGRWP